MTFLRKIVITMLLLALAALAYPSSEMLIGASPYADKQEQIENLMTINITINGTSYVQMKDVSKTSLLEVYSILGRRVTAVSLKGSDGSIYIDIPNGIYIFKVGSVSTKAVVK